jgi:tellurite resistance protein TerC
MDPSSKGEFIGMTLEGRRASAGSGGMIPDAPMLSSGSTTDWAVFAATAIATLLLDRLIFGRSAHRVSFREACLRSLLFVSVGLGFTLYVKQSLGTERALAYVTAYLIEESLSVDNLFVFLVIFSYFRVPERYQPRVLTWGIVGAVVMRAIFIVAGTALLSRFHFMMYVFGAFLIYTGIKLGFSSKEDVDPEGNVAVKLARRFLRTTPDYHEQKFFVKQGGVLYGTPLFLVLIVIEFTDVLFAVDSVPAVLAISSDVYIVYTSNIFAILGLRALYFMLAGMMSRFHYLDLGLAVILTFVGAKMVFQDLYKVPNAISLSVIGTVLATSVIVSLLRPPKESPSPAAGAAKELDPPPHD